MSTPCFETNQQESAKFINLILNVMTKKWILFTFKHLFLIITHELEHGTIQKVDTISDQICFSCKGGAPSYRLVYKLH